MAKSDYLSRSDNRKLLKGKLKQWDEIDIDHIVEVSKHYWKIHKSSFNFISLEKKYVGFRTYYKKYFGQIVNVRKHKKYPHIYQIYSDRDMLMMDAFECWFEWIKDPEPFSEVTWDELFKM